MAYSDLFTILPKEYGSFCELYSPTTLNKCWIKSVGCTFSWKFFNTKSLIWARVVFFFFFKIYWLCWIFAAASRLSLVGVNGSYSLVAVLRLLIVGASLMEHRLESMRVSVVVVSRLATCRIIVLKAGVQPVSPQLAGKFLTTGSPGKFWTRVF